MIGYLEEVIRELALILAIMSGYVKTFKVKDGDKDKNKKYDVFLYRCWWQAITKIKTIWTKREKISKYQIRCFTSFDDRYIKSKIKTCRHEIYINFRGLNVYNTKYYLQVYLDNCACKILSTQVIDYLDDNVFESDQN